MAARELRFWLTGRAEEGYGPQRDEIVAAARIPVTIRAAPRAVDAYAAADVVVFPSTWEGFGNPVVESIAARRPLAVASYPVLDELVDLGLRFFAIDDPAAMVRWLEQPGERDGVLDSNLEVARTHFSIHDLPGRIAAAFETVGWTAW